MQSRHPRLSTVIAVAAALSFVGVVACSKPKAGAACSAAQAGKFKCVDKQNGLVCVGGKWEALSCEGPIGCMTVVGEGSCTHLKYEVGEPCLEEGKPECSGDRKAMIKCENNHWKLLDKCTGALGCVANAKGAKCDLGAAEAGSTCTPQNEGNAACTPDKKALLLCKSGKMVLGATCKGMHGCRQKGTTLECDETISELGDTCDSSEYEGKFACNPDKTMRLVCKSNKMVKDRACKCSVMIDKVNCN
ncbi:MAG: hypothetical protein HOO96_19190 [Polyangiaceae bacterium]|nr:hypothetical protein [Polyangiaceae bacterium]